MNILRSEDEDSSPNDHPPTMTNRPLLPTYPEYKPSGLPHVEEKSLAPVLAGEKTIDDNDVFLQWNGYGDRDLGSPSINRMVAMPWRSVVTADRWKLN